MPYLRNYKEFEGEILDLQLEKYGLSFETKKYTTSSWAQGDENVIGIRAFKGLIYPYPIFRQHLGGYSNIKANRDVPL